MPLAARLLATVALVLLLAGCQTPAMAPTPVPHAPVAPNSLVPPAPQATARTVTFGELAVTATAAARRPIATPTTGSP